MITIFELLGWIGMITFLVAYYGISSGKMKVNSLVYQWMNLGGAIAVGLSVLNKHAWPAFALEVVWGAIAVVMILRLIKTR